MKLLGSIGYREIETFGPYSWSAQVAQDRWNVTSQSLAFRGSGYFGLTPAAVRRLLDDNALTSPSMHTDLDSLRTRLEPMAEAARVLGQRYVVLPSIPASERQTLDAYRRMADEFNKIGAQAAKLGVRFTYHNHGYGLKAIDGIVPFELVVERTDPAVVDLQMDVYWVTAGGADPVAYLQRYKGRFKSLHVKDMAKPARFAGDGGDSSQWIALFPFIADAGRGVLDLPAILSAAKRSGVEHFFLERDQTPTPEATLRGSYKYLSSLR
jgi:sugar phosphate isomerase/epimerase